MFGQSYWCSKITRIACFILILYWWKNDQNKLIIWEITFLVINGFCLQYIALIIFHNKIYDKIFTWIIWDVSKIVDVSNLFEVGINQQKTKRKILWSPYLFQSKQVINSSNLYVKKILSFISLGI